MYYLCNMNSGGDLCLLSFFNDITYRHLRKRMLKCRYERKRIKMIDKARLIEFIKEELKDTPYFLVDVEIGADNAIQVEIDSRQPVDVDFCANLSRAIEAEFPREPEDYELEVGSAGLTSPFKVRQQYDKYLGQEVETLTREGKLLRGLLRKVDDDSFTIIVEAKEKPEGAKRPVKVEREITLRYDDVKHTKYHLKF